MKKMKRMKLVVNIVIIGAVDYLDDTDVRMESSSSSILALEGRRFLSW